MKSEDSSSSSDDDDAEESKEQNQNNVNSDFTINTEEMVMSDIVEEQDLEDDDQKDKDNEFKAVVRSPARLFKHDQRVNHKKNIRPATVLDEEDNEIFCRNLFEQQELKMQNLIRNN